MKSKMALAVLPRLGQAGSRPLSLAVLHAVAIALFVHGFLLTRVRLNERNTNTAGPPVRSKLVWLMIDSLRYDFVVADGRYSCAPGRLCHQGRMAYLNNLTSQAQGARAFRFIADPPTTTTQRLKSLMTGGLPSFFDVSSSFSAGHVQEDNLVDQLDAAGKKLAFVGDTTWGQLFPTQFTTAVAFPCFNVKDLHTVDDGVWEHLLPMLRQPGSWDVLVAHYLGVDHAGHAHGVDSVEMVAKLRQMDAHIQQVVEEMMGRAGLGEEFEHALVLVSGDHGQTLNGDHGGGSPEEVDSVLVAIDPSALHRLRQSGGDNGSLGSEHAAGGPGPASAGQHAGAAGAGSLTSGQQGHQQGPPLWALAPCRRNCSCGPDANQCAVDLPQMDLTPTLAALLGVPIPFGNLGKTSPELWGFAVATGQPGEEGAKGGGAAEGAWQEEATEPDARLQAVLRANVEQVHAYLNAYANTRGAAFSSSALRDLNSMYDGLAVQGTAPGGAAEQNARHLAFLEAAAALASEQWTQFGDLSMLTGLALFAAALLLHTVAAFGGYRSPQLEKRTKVPASKGCQPGMLRSCASSLMVALEGMGCVRRPAGACWPVPTVGGALAVLAGIHALGIFSFFFLLSEGSRLCYIMAAMFILLAASVILHPHQQRARPPAGGPSLPPTQHNGSFQAPSFGIKRPMQALLLALLLLGSNAAMAAWGLANHSGLAFWHRLTVHPAPSPQQTQASQAAGPGEVAATGLWAWLLGVLPTKGRDTLRPGASLLWAMAGHGVLCLLPVACLAAMALHMMGRQSSRESVCTLALRLQRHLLAAAFASVAAYHCCEQLVQLGALHKDTRASQLLQLGSAGGGRYCSAARPAWEVLWMAVQTAAAQLPQFIGSFGGLVISSGQRLLATPLRLLFPQLTYFFCGASLLAWAAQQVQRRVQRRAANGVAAQLLCSNAVDAEQHGQQQSKNHAGSVHHLPASTRGIAGAEELAGMAAGAAGLQGPLLGALLQVSDSSTPALLLLGAVQLWAAAQLLGIRSRQLGAGAVVGMEGAAVLAMAQAQMFFTTGHLCEFAGLQYLAGFVGYDEFHLLRSAVLLTIHTFGAMMLVALSLPTVLATILAPADVAGLRQQAQAQPLSTQPQWWRAVLVFLLVRACTGFAAAVSAAVQRRHLYAWSLFAPKFAFELVFLLGTDLLVSLMCLLL